MKSRPPTVIEICLLAGGLSQRMGRDKSGLRLGRRTMLGQIRVEAKKLDLPLRIIRRDVVRRCGPVGGVYTALKTTRVDAIMFLACDMPFVTEALLRALLRRFGSRSKALFVCSDGKAGFPFILRRDALEIVTNQLKQQDFSLHGLADVLKAKTMRAPPGWRRQLRNVNTPEEWECAVRLWNTTRDA